MKYKVAFNKLKYAAKPETPNWEQLNTSFVNGEVEPIKFADLIYRGHPFCAWMNGKRKKENFTLAQIIGIDLDTGDERSSFATLQNHPLVQMYGAMMYETPSHSKAHPRTRVIFFIDEPIKSVEGYEFALEAVYSMFDGADASCVDASRFFYGNGLLRQMTHTDGIWFDGDMVIPIDDLRRYAKQYQLNTRQLLETEAQKIKYQPTGVYKADDNKMPLDDLQSALDRVDAYGLDYGEWFKLCCAIAHEYGDSAFGVVKQWSDKPDKKPLTNTKWRDMVKSHSNAAGYGTIVKVLQERGVME